MKLVFRAIFLSICLISLISCDTNSNQKRTSYVQIEDVDLISSGGQQQGKLLCPKTVNDIIVQLKDEKNESSEDFPEMTMEGILSFIKENNITTITDLLNRLPVHYRNNFSLVEHTKGEGQSSLKFPRIVLFGSDGTFLMNISTKADDPKYDLLDCAELNEENGTWEFSQFDFTGDQPKLHVNPQSCIRCHGDQPRPVWGTNMDWPGVFGDNEATGPNGEALSYRHALRMNEIKEGNTYSDRFEFLEWSDQKLKSGGIRRIANHAFGAELLVSNMAIGTATARGVFKRMKLHTQYHQMREAMLLLGYEHMVGNILSDKEKEYLKTLILDKGGKKGTLDELFSVLGIDTKEAFSLGTLAKEEKPKTDWSLGAGDLYEQVLLQILYDLSIDDHNITSLLKETPNTPGIFGCDHLGENIKEVIDFKMLQMHQLLGKDRYEVNKVYYSQDAENIKEKVFIPIYGKLAPYLKEKIQIRNQV